MTRMSDFFEYVLANDAGEGVEVVNTEKSAGCVTEDCIVRFGGDFKNLRMKVKVVNGKREGEALIMDKESLEMRFGYVGNVLNGLVEILDDGEVAIRGHLVNGKESGLFEEYIDGMVIWRGYYRKGTRYSVVWKSERYPGFYEERYEMSRHLLSVAEYDKGLLDKNGYCIEYRNGMITKCLYENGVVKEILEESDGKRKCTPSGAKRKCTANEESKRVYLDDMSNEFNKDSLVLYDMEIECNYGVWKTSEKCSELRQSLFENKVVEVDLRSHEMRVFNENEVKESVREEGCIDLDVNGRRWEGGVKDGKPFGFGVLFDEEGKKEYEGFMMDGMKVCYGKEYYSDIDRINYDGCYYEGKRFGKGIVYDRNGGVEYEGLWKDDKKYTCKSKCKYHFGCSDKSLLKMVYALGRLSSEEGVSRNERVPKMMELDNHKRRTEISNHTQVLTISEESFYCVSSFILSHWFQSLKKIVIKNNCFVYVYLFVLDGLDALEELEIEEECFEDEDEKISGQFRIVNCPKLKSIQIGQQSFSNYRTFKLKNLPSLESIEVGQYCFEHAPSFSLIDLPQLQSVKLGSEAFQYCHSVVFENLPKLQSIQLDYGALHGDDRANRKTIRVEPYNFKNTLTMKNLPSLTSFNGYYNFRNIGSVILESDNV